MTNNNLSQNFTVRSLLKFTAPATIMLVFMSLYQMVDGIFVSNFVGETALSALNIVYPVISIVLAVSIMLSTGGSAVIAKKMGEGKGQEARENFSLIICAGAVLGILFAVFGMLFIEPIIHLMGATDALYPYCYEYLWILVVSAPLAIFQVLFQNFFVVAGRPNVGLIMTIIGGVSNIVFDYLFIVQLQYGLAGAALGTTIGYSIPAIFGLFYFLYHRKGTLYLVKPQLDIRMLISSCGNGASEMVSNLAVAVTTFLFNIMMMRYLGETGVAAITIILYAQFLLTSVFIGFSSGIAPVISYNYGARHTALLKRIFKICMGFIIFLSLLVFLVAEFFPTPIISVFAAPGSRVFQITRHGFTLFAFSFLFTGINIFASSMFTAFSNGRVSAAISFLRTFAFLVASLLLLPQFIGVEGIWIAVPLAEGLTILLSFVYFLKYRHIYHYL